MGVGSMDWEEKRGEMGVKGDKRADMGALEIAIQILEIKHFPRPHTFIFGQKMWDWLWLCIGAS